MDRGKDSFRNCSYRRQTVVFDALSDSVFQVETLGLSVAKRR